jgi:TRAP-type C4-dicarboxylate transport system substrate-binding protein
MTGMSANPTAMSWADAQPALASGAVDGQENPMEIFLALKIATLGQKFVTKWNYSNDILLFAIANPIWQSWSPQDQKIVREAAQAAAKENIRQVRDSFAKDVELVRAAGVDVVVPTPAEMEAWQIACRRPYARWKAQINAPLITKFEDHNTLHASEAAMLKEQFHVFDTRIPQAEQIARAAEWSEQKRTLAQKYGAAAQVIGTFAAEFRERAGLI